MMSNLPLFHFAELRLSFPPLPPPSLSRNAASSWSMKCRLHHQLPALLVLLSLSAPQSVRSAFFFPAFSVPPSFSLHTRRHISDLHQIRTAKPQSASPPSFQKQSFGAKMSSSSVEEALEMCRTSPKAVIVTVWPTAHSQVDQARKWIQDSKAKILYEGEVDIKQEAAVPCVMALYYGEEWLESNCWYMESPLPSGPPDSPYAGAKWKAALAFSSAAPLHLFVVDTSAAGASLWSSKYSIRERLRQAVGSLGNSCLHLTDDQAKALAKWRGGGGVSNAGGYSCDSSYAFHCARVLLNPHSVAFLNSCDFTAPSFPSRFQAYCAWLADPAFQDLSTAPTSTRSSSSKAGPGSDSPRFNDPPAWQ